MLGEDHPIVRSIEQETMYQANVILGETENWEVCALDHQGQHKWFPEHFVATASSRPLSSKPPQSADSPWERICRQGQADADTHDREHHVPSPYLL